MGVLVLKRKLGERIVIGDDVVIEVTEINTGSVKLAITAPTSIKVDREEVRNRPRTPPPAPKPTREFPPVDPAMDYK